VASREIEIEIGVEAEDTPKGPPYLSDPN